MSQMALMTGAPLAYREGQALTAGQRTLALAVAIGLHVAVIGGFVVAQMREAPAPPTPTLTVSFITPAEAAAAPAPAPPQPVEPTPAPPAPAPQATPRQTVMATPTPTPSPITAPPIERISPTPAPAPAAAPPTPAPSAAPAASTAAPGPTAPPSFKAAYLNNPGPVYPQGARMQRRQGTARLRVQVSAEGAPVQVTLDRSSGHSDLDKSAIDVVRTRWRFAPAMQEGRPVAGWVVVPIEFSITR